MRLRFALGPLSALLLLSQISAADVVTDWNSTAVDVVSRLGLDSNHGTRAIAIAQLAAYDAVVSVTRTHAPHLAYLPVPAGSVSLEAAVASAAHDALLLLYPSEAAYLADNLEASLAIVPNGTAKENGIALGHHSAQNLGFERLNDGSAASESYNPPFSIGQWVPTAPSAAQALDPEWRSVRPFGIVSPSAFRAPQPPAIGSDEYAAAFNEVKALGSRTSTTRTAEQTAIANFWAQPTQVPFNAIARTLSERAGLTLEENARLFALLNIALADARIAAWDTEYHYGIWRPITAIRFPFHDDDPNLPATIANNSEDDGNANTAPDANWEPLLATPPHPEYVSDYSSTGAAGAAVLAAFFGDDASFEVGSDAPASERSFSSLTAASEELALSRLYAGSNFGYSTQRGLDLGKKIGRYVAENLLAKQEAGDGGAAGTGGNAGSTSSEAAAGGDGEAGGAAGEAGSGGAPVAPPVHYTNRDEELIDRYTSDHGCLCSTVGGSSSYTTALGWVSSLSLVAAFLARTRRRR